MFTQSPAEKQYKGSSENYAHTQQHTRASPATVSFHCHLPDLYSETPFFYNHNNSIISINLTLCPILLPLNGFIEPHVYEDCV